MYLLMGTVVFCLDIVITLAGRTCEPIKIPICQKHLPYNMTMFPNALEHLTQQYSRQRIELYSDIVAINCSADAGFSSVPITYPSVHQSLNPGQFVRADQFAKRSWESVCLPSENTTGSGPPTSFVRTCHPMKATFASSLSPLLNLVSKIKAALFAS